ncbi:SymE family type I addiction module toxin [Marinomonas sp. S3726]|nr:SymE family type I addiction module toxin [Marinomonas sp. S3726]
MSDLNCYLQGFWLVQAGFEIEAPYTIEVYDKKLVFTVA